MRHRIPTPRTSPVTRVIALLGEQGLPGGCDDRMMVIRDRRLAGFSALATAALLASALGCGAEPPSVANSAWITSVAPTSDPLVYEAEVVGAENCQIGLDLQEESAVIRIVVRIGACSTASGEAKPGAPVGTSRWLGFRLAEERGSRAMVTPDPDDPSADVTPRVFPTPRT